MSISMEAVGCIAVHQTVLHPLLLLFPTTLLICLVYRIIHPNILPGHPSTLTLLLPGAKQSHPYAATLSPLSYLRARWALRCYARSLGLPGGTTLVKEMREDEEYDWAAGEKPERGDLLRGWDRAMIWDKDCIDLVVLESWRSLSDPLADDALQSAMQRGPSDVMQQIAQHRVDSIQRKADSSPDAPLLDFWKAVDRRPPRGCGAIGLDWYQAKGLLSAKEHDQRGHCDIDDVFTRIGSWRPDGKTAGEQEEPTEDELLEEARILQRGKDMFYRYGPPILVGLMHVGLSGGFASPRITDVLKATGYLMSGKKGRSKEAHQRLQDNIDLVESKVGSTTLPTEAASARTFQRLLETTSFVLDIMEDSNSLSPPSLAAPGKVTASSGEELLGQGGAGWLACCRVRFIHTNVRRRLLPAGNLSQAYSASNGVPINQEDLLATLTSFSIAPLYTLQRMGLSPSQQERNDYLALWRHVGFYMGIEPHLLARVFRDVGSAERFFCCVASHHFLAVTEFKRMPSPPPISSHFGRDAEEVKRFHFDQGPALPLLYSVAKRPPGNMNFSSLCCLSRFLLGDALANAVSLPSMTRRQYMGIRLRLLVLAYPPLFARYYPRRRFGQQLANNCKGLLRRVIVWSLKGETVSFESDRHSKQNEARADTGVEEGKRLRREYFTLMYEMIAVSALVAIGSLVGLWWVALHLLDGLAAFKRNQCTI